jgi:hypothetical protein
MNVLNTSTEQKSHFVSTLFMNIRIQFVMTVFIILAGVSVSSWLNTEINTWHVYIRRAVLVTKTEEIDSIQDIRKQSEHGDCAGQESKNTE